MHLLVHATAFWCLSWINKRWAARYFIAYIGRDVALAAGCDARNILNTEKWAER